MVTFHRGGAARVPAARKIQVVGALSPDMLLTDVLLLMQLVGERGKTSQSSRLTKRASADGHRSEHLSH